MAETPTRIAGRIPKEEWLPFVAKVTARGETVTDVFRRTIRRYPDDSYRAEVYRDGKWWMIRVPALDAITQARTQGEVWLMARDLIATTLNITDPNSIAVELVMLPTAQEA